MTGRTLYSIRQASRLTGIGRDAIASAIRAGELPAARLGKRTLRVRAADLDRWVDAHTVKPHARADAVVDRVLAREARRAG